LKWARALAIKLGAAQEIIALDDIASRILRAA
jgi:hypothetical protein